MSVDATAAVSSFDRRRLIIDVALGALLLGLAFFGVAASDVHAGFSEAYWYALTVIFGLIAFAFTWLHRGEGFAPLRTAMLIGIDWIGVFLAVNVVFYFVTTDHFTDANVGLANGVLFALASFISGVHLQPRLAVVGVAIGAATAAEALIEENLFLLLAIAIAALALQVGFDPIRRRLEQRFGTPHA